VKTCFLNVLRAFGIPSRLFRLLTAVAIAALGLTKISETLAQMSGLNTYLPAVLTALDAELQSASGCCYCACISKVWLAIDTVDRLLTVW